MRRMALMISISTCVGLPLAAQGVPTQDIIGIGRLSALLANLSKDLNTQKTHLATGETLASIQADQLRVLDAMSTALTGPSLDIQSLEGNAGGYY